MKPINSFSPIGIGRQTSKARKQCVCGGGHAEDAAAQVVHLNLEIIINVAATSSLQFSKSYPLGGP